MHILVGLDSLRNIECSQWSDFRKSKIVLYDQGRTFMASFLNFISNILASVLSAYIETYWLPLVKKYFMIRPFVKKCLVPLKSASTLLEPFAAFLRIVPGQCTHMNYIY